MDPVVMGTSTMNLDERFLSFGFPFVRLSPVGGLSDDMKKWQTAKNKNSLVRKLELSDKGKGFIELLQQLTICDSVSDKDFEDRFKELSTRAENHQVFVIEARSGKIVATGSVFIERKFIRNCGKVGHIEDIVVDANARGMQLGKKIINALTDYAHSMGCYRVILDCSVENKAFYEKCGYKQKEIQMVKYFI
ncbi:glucosamine 6-phosphate N-acetyltransferase-like [Pyrus communis]|uniref:glucosamine 6-phosphate N-acetyltransferase-like n=1 Tax=Pyrus communis TaxID=23211 RepID=UPI0035C25BBB